MFVGKRCLRFLFSKIDFHGWKEIYELYLSKKKVKHHPMVDSMLIHKCLTATNKVLFLQNGLSKRSLFIFIFTRWVRASYTFRLVILINGRING